VKLPRLRLKVAWKQFRVLLPDRPYVVQGTHFVLAGMPSVARFLWLSRRVQRQLASTPGLIGYALYAEPLGRAYWTVSAWDDRAAVDRFIATPPHADVMRTLPGAMRATAAWTAAGADLPPSWPSVLGRLRRTEQDPTE
jgi:quinol monooxygenase YgiN